MGSQRIGHDWATNTFMKFNELAFVFLISSWYSFCKNYFKIYLYGEKKKPTKWFKQREKNWKLCRHDGDCNVYISRSWGSLGGKIYKCTKHLSKYLSHSASGRVISCQTDRMFKTKAGWGAWWELLRVGVSQWGGEDWRVDMKFLTASWRKLWRPSWQFCKHWGQWISENKQQVSQEITHVGQFDSPLKMELLG